VIDTPSGKQKMTDNKKVLDFKGFSQNGDASKLWSGNDFSNLRSVSHN